MYKAKMTNSKIKSTTIIGIRKNNLVVIAGDGQASFGNTVMKSNVKKIISRDKYFEFSSNKKSIFFKTFQTALNYELIDFKFKYSKLNEIYLKVTE